MDFLSGPADGRGIPGRPLVLLPPGTLGALTSGPAVSEGPRSAWLTSFRSRVFIFSLPAEEWRRAGGETANGIDWLPSGARRQRSAHAVRAQDLICRQVDLTPGPNIRRVSNALSARCVTSRNPY
ncbi:hypothetical protein SKAU_G00345980 [Synaphobranchus kaupii]|uniref:Uncharacterized protein n=1 Tax=Synaphobranchus kaupii TaxID=118154 RepID=A0A9Q1EJK3_SYNKA|nr:hypothetical protein SKAU_G00345980 [Synaphobranchus kaupii]